MIEQILVPYDQSEPANRALKVATDLAKRYKSQISIVACIVPQVPMDPTLGESFAETLVALQRSAATALAKLESDLKDLQIPARSEVLSGTSVADAVLSYAGTHKIDLIVMGSRGLGGFKKMLLGSVASTVSEHSTCPVLIVK